MTKSEKKHASKNTLALLLIALPGITYLIINNYIPIIGTFIAFKKFSYAKGIWGSPWCGLDNFKFLFLTDDAWVITRNTLLYNLAFIVIGTVVSVIFAILLHELGELLRGKFFQSVLLFPHLLSWVVTAYLVYALLGSTTGFVNNTILDALGKKGVDWYTAKAAWPFILVIVYLWKNAGYNAIVYMAGIAGIDKEIYEAAAIEGAGKFRQIFSITLPLIVPQIVTLVLLDVGRIFKGDFQMFYQVTGNNPLLYETTDVIDTFVVRSLLQLQDVGMSSAAGLMQSVINFVILVTVNAVVKHFESDYALF